MRIRICCIKKLNFVFLRMGVRLMFNSKIKTISAFAWIFCILFIEKLYILLALTLVLLVFLRLVEKKSLPVICHHLSHILPFVILMFITLSISGGIPLAEDAVKFAFLICSRVIVATLVLYAMVGNQGIDEFIATLATMGFPAKFISILYLTNRYIHIFREDLKTQLQTLKSRMFTLNKTNFFVLKSMGYVLGGMFIKAFERSERIYMAMKARSYSGVVAMVEVKKVSAVDVVLLICSAGILSVAMAANMMMG